MARSVLLAILLLCPGLPAAAAPAGPGLKISPLGYRIEQIQPVSTKPGVFDITARAGICGDAATGVSARLTSSSSAFAVLDGSVQFGDLPRASCLRPIVSQDTFTLRVVAPSHRTPAQLLEFIQLLLTSFSWTISCQQCGGNRAPVADAGPDQTGHVTELVTLDGSRSADADGQPLGYAWTIIQRPSGSASQLSGSATVRPTLVPDREGEYLVRLVVSDGNLVSAPDTVRIDTLNSPPVAHAGKAQTVALGQKAILDGTTSTDVDGDALTYQWSVTSRPAGSDAQVTDSTASVAGLVPDVSGQYTIALVVHDGTVPSAPATTIISTVNSRPVADAGADQTAAIGARVLLDGSRSRDVDGDPLSFRWSLLTVPSGSAATVNGPASVTPSLTLDRSGTYVVQLIVNDGTADGDADTVVISTSNSRPVADAGPARQVPSNTVVTLDGTLSTDADFNPLTYAWSILSQPAGSSAALDDATATQPSFPADRPGQYVVQLVVNDGIVNSAPVTVVITAVQAPQPPGPIARLELSPSAVLLTAVNERRGLEVRAFDASGARIGFIPSGVLEFLTSNDEQVSVDDFGGVEAKTMPGSALVRVRLRGDHEIASAPVLVTTAQLSIRETVILLTDEEIAGDPDLLDAADRRYAVKLTRGLEVGALILGSGARAVIGRIVAVDPQGEDGTFRTEFRLAPLTAFFEEFRASYKFTPEELSGFIEEEPAPAPLRAARTASVGLMQLTSEIAGGACSLKFDANTALTADVHGQVTPNLGFDLDVSITEGSLDRFTAIATGSVDASLTLTANASAAASAKGECKRRLASILVPIGGPLSLLLGVRIPIGLTGSLEATVQQNLATVTIEQNVTAFTTLGVSYVRGQGLVPVNTVDVVATTADPIVDIPSSSLRFTGKAFLGGTAGIAFGVLGSGGPLFEVVSLSGGPAFEARFGEPYDVSSDEAFDAGYELTLVGNAGAGDDIGKFMDEVFDTVPAPFDTSVSTEWLLATSPKRGAIMQADRAEFSSGDTVTFRIDLNPASVAFPLFGYNVLEVRVYERDENAQTARLVTSMAATPGQLSLTLPWTADHDGRTTNPTSGKDNFFAFVVPNLLSTVSSLYPLELGPVAGLAPIEILPHDVVLASGATRQFRARIDGQDSTNVTWSATGGTISSTGFFQAGQAPGTYKVTVARADAPNVRDEATVEVRPQCVPGNGAGYCGFSYVSRFFPGTNWGNTAVNDHGDWVTLSFDASQYADSGLKTPVFIGRGDNVQEVAGLNDSAVTYIGFREGDVTVAPHGYFELTNTNAFAGYVVRNGNVEGFVSQNGQTRFLAPLAGDAEAHAYDVSDDLIVVGSSSDRTSLRAVRWIDGVPQDLNAGPLSMAVGVSPDGHRILINQVSGGAWSILIWHDGTITSLPESTGCFAYDMNSQGDVVAICSTEGTGAGALWRSGDKAVLDFAPYAINDQGVILGARSQNGARVGVLWRDGALHDTEFGPYVDGPLRYVTSLSRTKSLLGGAGVGCVVNNCKSYVWVGYPIELLIR